MCRIMILLNPKNDIWVETESMLMLMLWFYYEINELAWIWFKWMRMRLCHDCCDYTYVNDINSAYMVDEVMWKCVGLMLSAKLYC
jgi:hypothetical protein